MKMIKFIFHFIKDYLYWQFIKKMVFRVHKDEWVIICPYGIGDTYFICALLKEFLQYHKGNKISLVVKDRHKEVPRLFPEDIHRVIIKDNLNLNAIKRFSKFQSGNIIIGHPLYINEGSLSLLGYKDITLVDIYRAIVLRIPLNSKLSQPIVKDECKTKVFEQLSSLKIPKDRTVILAPYAVSVNNLEPIFWIKLAKKLKQMGWVVCTNVDSNNTETILDTIPITFPLGEAISVIEYAGWFISCRSGLCDLVSTAICKKSIIYPNQKWHSDSVFSSTSIKKMGLTEMVFEYEFGEKGDMDLLVEKILLD